MEQNRRDSVFLYVLFLVMFVIAFGLSISLSVKAMLFPILTAVLGIGFTSIAILGYVKGHRITSWYRHNNNRRAIGNARGNESRQDVMSMLIILGYSITCVLLGPLVGLPIATFLHVIVSSRSFVLAIMLCVVAILIMMIFNTQLHVAIPRGLLL